MAASRRNPFARLAALPARRLDALIALAFAVEGSLEVLLWSPLAGPRLLAGFTVVALVSAGVLLRRTAPLAAIVLPHREQRDRPRHDGPHGGTDLRHAAGDVHGRHAARGPPPDRGFLIGAATVSVAFALLSEDRNVPNLVFTITFFAAAPMLLGQLLVNRARLNRALGDKARRAEAERRQRTELAALEERTRIAGELHDVVAHALSAMTVQAAGARRLSERDPARARDAFATVESTGREALAELRRLLGVLRKEDEELALAPQPSLAHVESLVRRAEAGGLPVRLHVSGPVRRLPAGVDLTAYRLVQEALGGARDAGRRRRLARQRQSAARGRLVRLPRRIEPRVLDRGLCVLFAALAVVDLATGAAVGSPVVIAPGFAVLIFLPLARRRAPIAAIAIWSCVLTGMVAAGADPYEMTTAFVGLFVYPYAAGAYADGARVLVGLRDRVQAVVLAYESGIAVPGRQSA